MNVDHFEPGQCGGPSPAVPSTWGQVKTGYR
jgi:hypothetical protein